MGYKKGGAPTIEVEAPHDSFLISPLTKQNSIPKANVDRYNSLYYHMVFS